MRRSCEPGYASTPCSRVRAFPHPRSDSRSDLVARRPTHWRFQSTGTLRTRSESACQAESENGTADDRKTHARRFPRARSPLHLASGSRFFPGPAWSPIARPGADRFRRNEDEERGGRCRRSRACSDYYDMIKQHDRQNPQTDPARILRQVSTSPASRWPSQAPWGADSRKKVARSPEGSWGLEYYPEAGAVLPVTRRLSGLSRTV